MARPTLRNVRDNIDTRNLGQTGLKNDQQIKRRILKREFDATGNPAIAIALNQQSKLVARQAAAKTYGQPKRRTKPIKQQGQRKNFASPEGFNECGIATGRSHASTAAERMEQKQAGFPDVMRHPTTIGIAILPMTASVANEINTARPGLRKTFEQLTHGCQVSGGFHIVLKTAEELAEIFSTDELPQGCNPALRPDELFAYLHWHGVIADTYYTKSDIRRILKAAYPGCKRVCVAKVQPERTDKDGQITHGARGYFEYAMMNKTDAKVKGPEQKKDAVIGYAMLDATWGKRNRSFSFGKPLSITGVQIDPNRVAQLELMERLDHVKKKWDRLTSRETSAAN